MSTAYNISYRDATLKDGEIYYQSNFDKFKVSESVAIIEPSPQIKAESDMENIVILQNGSSILHDLDGVSYRKNIDATKLLCSYLGVDHKEVSKKVLGNNLGKNGLTISASSKLTERLESFMSKNPDLANFIKNRKKESLTDILPKLGDKLESSGLKGALKLERFGTDRPEIPDIDIDVTTNKKPRKLGMRR